MASAFPTVDVSRFKAITPQTVVLAYLRSSRSGITDKVLKQRLAGLLSAELLQSALAALRNEGLVTSTPTLQLSDAGRHAADRRLGRDAGRPWEKVTSRTLPLIALGLDPDALANVTIDVLRARAIAVGFEVTELKNSATKASVRGALVWQTLKGSMSDVFGQGPFPPIARLGPVENILLAKLANTQAKTADKTFAALAAASVGARETDADSFRKGLIRAGLRTQTDSDEQTEKVRLRTDDGFAGRVKSVAGDLSTPPFLGRVSISQVYDAYGRAHGDAGPLAAFKSRLVEAAQRRSLELGRLDLPEQMDRDQRLRSEARWGDNVVHFVITARK